MRVLEGLQLRTQRWRWRLRLLGRAAARPAEANANFVEPHDGEYQTIWASAAHQLGAGIEQVGDGVWEVRRGRQRTQIAGRLVQFADAVEIRLTADRPYIMKVTSAYGLPVPEQEVNRLEETELARLFQSRIGAPLCVKPAIRPPSHEGTSLYVSAPGELTAAMGYGSVFSPRILLQRTVAGEAYRLLFLDGKLLAAVRRRGVHVVGDGRSTIRELLLKQDLGLLVDLPDLPLQLVLESQNLMLGAWLPAGRGVLVRDFPGAEQPAPPWNSTNLENVAHLMSPPLVAQLRTALDNMGLRYASVHIVTCDPTVELANGRGAVIGVDAAPDLLRHIAGDSSHASVDIGAAVLDRALASALSERKAFGAAGDARQSA